MRSGGEALEISSAADRALDSTKVELTAGGRQAAMRQREKTGKRP
jgi:hypothetical protein